HERKCERKQTAGHELVVPPLYASRGGCTRPRRLESSSETAAEAMKPTPIDRMTMPCANITEPISSNRLLTTMAPRPRALSTMPACTDQKIRLSGALMLRALDACGSAGISVRLLPAGDC